MMELFKLDSKGKLRVLRLWAEDSIVMQESGLVDGKKTIRESQCVGKNIGKNNETTSEEQAISEADAKYVKKLKEGYFKTRDEALSEVVILPTLAHEYKKHSRKVAFPCYVQPKLDGMRCLGINTGLKSRKNTPIETMDHILNELCDIRNYFDGELYSGGLSFQENMKLIKKKRHNSSDIKYHVYDMILDMPFIKRYEALGKLVAANNMKNVELVPTYKVNNIDDIKKYHSQFLNEGYEGTIIRWGDEIYPINKRSQYLLKYKDFLDIACEVIDIVPSEKQPTHGVAVCRLDNGGTFKCGMKFSHDDRIEILFNKDKYIGKKAEIRFFEYTDAGLPRFPVCVGFRLDK